MHPIEPRVTIVLDDNLHERRSLVLAEVMRRHEVLIVEDPLLLIALLSGARAPTALIAEQQTLGILLPIVGARLATLSSYPRLLLVGDGRRVIPPSVRPALGILAVLTRPLERDRLCALVDSLYLQQQRRAG